MSITKGQRLLSGVLSRDEIDEFDALEEICNNLTDLDGKSPFNHLKFIDRRTELLRKANDIFAKRNEEMNKMIVECETSIPGQMQVNPITSIVSIWDGTSWVDVKPKVLI